MHKRVQTCQRRRRLLQQLCCSAVVLPFLTPARAAAAQREIEVWKSPTCGCCNDWITHLEDNGFAVTRYQELYAPDDAPSMIEHVPADWARDYPSEQVWWLKKVCAT